MQGSADEPAHLDDPVGQLGDEEDFAHAQDAGVLEFGRLRNVVGRDDRQRIQDTQDFPWRCLCSLQIRYADGQDAVGTGWLAGARTVITAGHCVDSQNHGRAVAMLVRFGQNGNVAPFGSSNAIGLDVTTGWLNQRNQANDFGAVFLPAGGNRPGPPLQAVALDNASLAGLEVNLAGYPAGRQGTLWWHARRLAQPRPSFLAYDVDTTGGQSGAPVWSVRANSAQVVGIHTNGTGQGNFGVRITDSVRRTIGIWIERGSAL